MGYTKEVISYVEIPVSYSGPEFMTYAAIAGNYLELNNTINVMDYGDPNTNASVHCNGQILLSNSGLIKGFVTYGSSITNDGSYTVVPNDNPGGLPTVYQNSDPVDLPAFNADDFIGIADEVYPTIQNFSGETITLGTIDDPKIIYFGQDLKMDGCTITGYGVFVVKGKTEIKGTTTQDPATSQIGLYGEGDMKIDNLVGELCANIYGEGNVHVNNGFTVYGSVAAKIDSNRVNNHINIYYRPPIESLTEPFFPGSGSGSNTRAIVRHWLE